MTDQQLIDQIRTGRSDKALSTLYNHFPMIRKMVRSADGSTADAEDIFQEALILLIRNIQERNFTLTSKLSTYLYGMCRLLWKEELRRRQRPVPPGLTQGLDDAEELSLNIEKEHDARLAEKILHELGERCRELLLLFYHGGLRLKDIAARMGYSTENTAKNQKYKCLEAAKLRLKQLQQSHQTL